MASLIRDRSTARNIAFNFLCYLYFAIIAKNIFYFAIIAYWQPKHAAKNINNGRLSDLKKMMSVFTKKTKLFSP